MMTTRAGLRPRRRSSISLLARSEEVFSREQSRSVSGGVIDPAGVRVQSDCRFPRERCGPDAIVAAYGQARRASGCDEALYPQPALHGARESGTGHALLPGHGKPVRWIV